MDDARDLVLVECPPERVAVGDVALDERDTRSFVLAEDQPESRVVGAEVEPHRLLAELEERGERPRAEAAERAGDERALRLRQAARPDTR